MAFYIDYNKCYNGNSQSLGKPNKISQVTIDVNSIIEESVDEYEMSSYYISSKSYFGYSQSKNGLQIGLDLKPVVVIDKRIEYYVSKLLITLSYDTYPGLQLASSVSMSNVSHLGTYKEVILEDKAFAEPKDYSKPIILDGNFANALSKEIVNSSSPTTNQISYSEVNNTINQFENFEPIFGNKNFANIYPIAKLNKYDNYCTIELEFISKIALYDSTKDSWGIINGAILKMFDYSEVKFNISYQSPQINSETHTKSFGEDNSSYLFSNDSFMFVEGNTYSNIDYANYYAGSIIDEFFDGKNILSITIPVANFELEDSSKIILEEGDECYVVKGIGEKWVEITNSFTIQSGDLQSNVNKIYEIDGIKANKTTRFTGRIYFNQSHTFYQDYNQVELPITKKFTVSSSDGTTTETYLTINEPTIDGIILVSNNDDFVNFISCENCIIEQFLHDYESLFFDKDNKEQLFKVIYQNFKYSGMCMQDIKLEPINIIKDNSVYLNDFNVVTGINENVQDELKVANIPSKIKAYTINEIGNGFAQGNDVLEKIVIPFSIKKIGDMAFSNTQGIRTSLVLPNGLEYIGEYAFYASNIIGNLTIPEGVTHIGAGAFQNCQYLNGTLIVPSTYKFDTSGTFSGCKNLSKIIIYSNEIEAYEIDNFEDTGDCPIYVLDSLIGLFKQKMTNQANRIFSLGEHINN